MKTQKIWALNPNDQKLKATWGGDGELRMNDNLFKILPEYIQVFFEPELRELRIDGSTEEKGGLKNVRQCVCPTRTCSR